VPVGVRPEWLLRLPTKRTQIKPAASRRSIDWGGSINDGYKDTDNR